MRTACGVTKSGTRSRTNGVEIGCGQPAVGILVWWRLGASGRPLQRARAMCRRDLNDLRRCGMGEGSIDETGRVAEVRPL